MAELLLFVMLVAATLYAVFGGADFGVGLVEGFLPAHERKRVDTALSPVWEANHVWLVLVAVLAFVGFPRLYTVVTTFLHVPLMLVLLGIVARGTAFTFRHYDPGGALRGVYSAVFRVASFLTPFFLGVIVATIASGHLRSDLQAGFYALYVAPWCTPFAFATGLFVCALFAFQGAALLAAEFATAGESLPYLRLARRLHLTAIALGGLTLWTSYAEHTPLAQGLLRHPLSIASFVVATLLVPVVARAFATGRPWLLRGASFAQLTLVLLGFCAAQFPTLVHITPHAVRFPDAAAAPAVLNGLTVAVVVGLSTIVPSLAYLLRVYKAR